jgi:hypothetical protein
MGLLSAAIFQGAGQGLNALSQGMFRQVEREAEEDIWQKRTRLLSEIQRENAKTAREDDFKFRNDPANVQAEVGTATTKAQAAAKVAREEALRAETDPGLIAAREAAAERDAAQKRKAYEAETPLVVSRQGQASEAAAKAAAKYRERSGEPKTLSAQKAEYEKFLGRELTKAEAEAMTPFGRKAPDGIQAQRVKLAEEVTSKLIENGEVKPEDRAASVQAQLRGYAELEQATIAQSLLQQARADGSVSTWVQRMRAQGAKDEELIALGATKQEIGGGDKPKPGPTRNRPAPVNAAFGTPEYDRATLGMLGSSVLSPGNFRQDFSRFNEPR